MESSLNSQHIVRLLADGKRRKVVAALILADGPLAATDLVNPTGLVLRDVVDAIDRLVNGGLVDGDSDGCTLIADVFQHAARSEAPAMPESAHSDQPDDIARVLDLAFKEGRLVQWPAKRTKRLLVLDHMVQKFDIGKRYKEAEVNNRLREFNDDVATMRRYLVDEQFLDRSSGEYWRCGGTF